MSRVGFSTGRGYLEIVDKARYAETAATDFSSGVWAKYIYSTTGLEAGKTYQFIYIHEDIAHQCIFTLAKIPYEVLPAFEKVARFYLPPSFSATHKYVPYVEYNGDRIAFNGTIDDTTLFDLDILDICFREIK